MNVVFVGSNPSTKNIDPSIPFKGTKSDTVMQRWISYLELMECSYVNVMDEITLNNKPLTTRQVKMNLPKLKAKLDYFKYDRVIALGRVASEALRTLGITHYRLPHPSPKNRQLNNKESLQKNLEECKVYIWK